MTPEYLEASAQSTVEQSQQRGFLRPILGGCAVALSALAVAMPFHAKAATESRPGATPVAFADSVISEPCGPIAEKSTDSLKIVGSHMEDSAGHVVVPQGISIVGGPEIPAYLQTEAATNAQIDAGRAWHINSVRLQVSESELIDHSTQGYNYNRTFAQYVNQLVCKVLKLHDIPIINDNPLFTGNQLEPTEKTVKFWDFESEVWKNYPVIFDTENEPKLFHEPGSQAVMSTQRMWNLWQWGGRVGGVNYVGMQTLTDDIRSQGAHNIIWEEVAHGASDIAELPQHLIKGTNIAYSFHKKSLSTMSQWFPQLASLVHHGISMEDGEWSFFGADNRPWECSNDGPAAIPKYFSGLNTLGIGKQIWSLQPGVMVKGSPGQAVHDGNYTGYVTNPLALTIPSTLKPNFACNRQSIGQGAGALVMENFKQHSKAVPLALFPKFSRTS